MACGAIPESFPALDAEPRSRVAHEKSVAGFIVLSEKQYQISTRGARNWSIFLLERASPRQDAFAALENDNFLFFMITGCSANRRAHRGMTRNGKLAGKRAAAFIRRECDSGPGQSEAHLPARAIGR
jgi:hypothetical protein